MAAHCITQIFQKGLQILELDRLALISKRDAPFFAHLSCDECSDSPGHESNACGGWHCNTQQYKIRRRCTSRSQAKENRLALYAES